MDIILDHLKIVDTLIVHEDLTIEEYKIIYDYMNKLNRKIIIKQFDIPLAYTEEQKNII